jgi:osmotically-inducible protein OsmY
MSTIPLFFLPVLLAVFIAQPIAQDSQSAPPSQDSSQSQPAPQRVESQNQVEVNRRIRDSINDLLSSDLVLNGTDVEAVVDDHNITLTGRVNSYAQHQRVLQLVSSYGRWRNIVDKLEK